MSRLDYSKMINNFMDDVTTALPYSEYIRANVGSYVIIEEKPYVIKSLRFTHQADIYTPNHLIICNIMTDSNFKAYRIEISLDKDLIFKGMDNPMILIDLINTHLSKSVKFIPKNKTTDLLFKKED